MSRDPDLIEAVARVLAQLNVGEDWPTNAALGGSLTGTRDDEYRDGVRQEARDVLYVIEPLIAAQVRAQIAADIEHERDYFAWATQTPRDHPLCRAYDDAARIARGDA